jgi:hypothetical protein
MCSAAIACALVVTAALSAQEAVQHAPDADVTTDRVQSITILPVPNAPFTATVVTESINIQPDGSKRTLYNRRIVARDSAGRVFQERRWLTATGNTQPPPLSMLQYEDPARHRMTLCNPLQHVCNTYEFNVHQPDAVSSSALSNTGAASVRREDLGTKMEGTLELIGSRETTQIAEGITPETKPEPMVKEYWYSPYLGINVVTKRLDPRVSAVQNFSVEDIDLKEPNHKLFNPPPDYRLMDESQARGPTVIVYNEYVSCSVFRACVGVLRPTTIRRKR